MILRNRWFKLVTGCGRTDHAPVKTFVPDPRCLTGAVGLEHRKKKLETAGQKVITVGLPAHGNDTKPPEAVTMDIYRDLVVSAIQVV